MKKKCPRCSNDEYEVPDFTQQEKRVLSGLKANNKLGELIEKLESLYDIRSIDAKFSLMHINKKYGKCNRCKVDYLEEEYVLCPKCNALNFNWSIDN